MRDAFAIYYIIIYTNWVYFTASTLHTQSHTFTPNSNNIFTTSNHTERKTWNLWNCLFLEKWRWCVASAVIWFWKNFCMFNLITNYYEFDNNVPFVRAHFICLHKEREGDIHAKTDNVFLSLKTDDGIHDIYSCLILCVKELKILRMSVYLQKEKLCRRSKGKRCGTLFAFPAFE